jgi:hypothetical protein
MPFRFAIVLRSIDGSQRVLYDAKSYINKREGESVGCVMLGVEKVVRRRTFAGYKLDQEAETRKVKVSSLGLALILNPIPSPAQKPPHTQNFLSTPTQRYQILISAVHTEI